MKRTRINPVSNKRAKELALYRRLRTEFLGLNRMCEAGIVLSAEGVDSKCTKQATEIHHKKKRGKNLNNVDSWLPVCRHCHDWIENNKSQARALNLLANIHDC